MNDALRRLASAVVKPTVRLKPDFPLTGRKLGQVYATSLGLFMAGNILPVVIFMVGLVGAIMLLQTDVLQDCVQSSLAAHTHMQRLSLFLLIGVLPCFGAWLTMWLGHYYRQQRTWGYLWAEIIVPLKRKTTLATMGSAALRLIGIGWLWFGINHATDMVATSRDWVGIHEEFLAFAWLTVLATPLLDAILFRTFLFQGLNAEMHEENLRRSNIGTSFYVFVYLTVVAGTFAALQLGGILAWSAKHVFLASAALALTTVLWQRLAHAYLLGCKSAGLGSILGSWRGFFKHHGELQLLVPVIWQVSVIYPVWLLLHVTNGDSAARDLTNIFIDDRRGEITSTMWVVMIALSFFPGFLMQMKYLLKHLHATGSSLTKALGLTTEPLRQRTALGTAWAIFWRTAAAFVFCIAAQVVLEWILHPPAQPTVDVAKQLAGGHFLVFALVAVSAGFFEEVVFRAFLFQGLRTTFIESQNDKPKPGRAHQSLAFIGCLMVPVALMSAKACYNTWFSGTFLANEPTEMRFADVLLHTKSAGYASWMEEHALLTTVLAVVSAFLLQIRYKVRLAKLDGGNTLSPTESVKKYFLQTSLGSMLLSFTWRAVLVYLVWLSLYAHETVVAVAQDVLRTEAKFLLGQPSFSPQFMMWAMALVASVPIVALSFAEVSVRNLPFQVCKWCGANPKRADYCAIFLSSAVFALIHMQFHPVTLLLLFLMGALLAELYRRTGSLWPSILLHAANNGLFVLLIGLGIQ